MPRVSRKYVRKDYSHLLNQLQNQQQESYVPQKAKISDRKETPPMISPAARRRASLMGNKNMRYVIFRNSQKVFQCFADSSGACTMCRNPSHIANFAIFSDKIIQCIDHNLPPDCIWLVVCKLVYCWKSMFIYFLIWLLTLTITSYHNIMQNSIYTQKESLRYGFLPYLGYFVRAFEATVKQSLCLNPCGTFLRWF